MRILATTHLRKSGDSYMILIPAEVMDKLPFLPLEILEVSIEKNSVVIKRKG